MPAFKRAKLHQALPSVVRGNPRHPHALRRDLISSGPALYGQTALWAEAVHHDIPDADGPVWTSNQCDPNDACLFFGDRVRERGFTAARSRDGATVKSFVKDVQEGTNMTTSREQFRQWLEAPEGARLEFKEARHSFHFEKLLQYCVALANEGGGQILLGVSDRRPRTIVGTRAFPEPGLRKPGCANGSATAYQLKSSSTTIDAS